MKKNQRIGCLLDALECIWNHLWPIALLIGIGLTIGYLSNRGEPVAGIRYEDLTPAQQQNMMEHQMLEDAYDGMSGW